MTKTRCFAADYCEKADENLKVLKMIDEEQWQNLEFENRKQSKFSVENKLKN